MDKKVEWLIIRTDVSDPYNSKTKWIEQLFAPCSEDKALRDLKQFANGEFKALQEKYGKNELWKKFSLSWGDIEKKKEEAKKNGNEEPIPDIVTIGSYNPKLEILIKWQMIRI